jgi:catechol 2,3-dioxygenase-like lactoylglutathione lyase family enzyme
MLPGRRTHTTLPTSDLDRGRAFYEGVLGFRPSDVSPGGVTYEAADGTTFLVFPSSGRAAGTHTQMGFTVPDIEAEVRELKERGVVFETYDMVGFDPSISIASFPGLRSAWFKDPDGNLLGIVQRMN